VKRSQNYTTLTEALINGAWYDFLAQPFQTSSMQARTEKITQALHDGSNIITPDYAYSPDVFDNLKEGETREIDDSQLKRLADKRMIETLKQKDALVFQLSADYRGLSLVYDMDRDTHGEAAAREHALSLLGGNAALFADFEKNKKNSTAINILVWSIVHEYEPDPSEPKQSTPAKRAAEKEARDTILAELEESGIGRQTALKMLQTLREQIGALAQQCGHGSGMTRQ
jgi:hypothetical protein